MLKNINKFSKLAVVFTISYWLVGRFIMSDMYSSVPDYLFRIIHYLYLGCMVTSIIVGIIGVIKADKAEEKGKWIILLLTLFNAFVLVLNTIAIIIFPLEFYIIQ